jgi:hypothetical protein
MAGYAVSGRIGAVAPRRARHVPSCAELDVTAEPIDDDAVIDVAGWWLESDLAVRWQSIRERWAQMTFFLFDAESWRT